MSYYRLIQEIQLQNSIRRSFVETEIVNERLRRSRVDAAIELQRARREADIATEAAIRRSRLQAEIDASRVAAETSLQRSRVEAQIRAENAVAEEAIRRSRIEAKVECERIEREAVLRRSRVQVSQRADLVSNIIEKSRLESELQQSRLHQHRAISEALRRSRIEAQTQRLSRKY